MSTERDALVFKRVDGCTALRRIPVDQVPQFVAHGWTLLASAADMHTADALETFAVEVTKPLNPPRWQSNGD